MSHDVHIVKTSDGYELIGKLMKMRNDEVIRVIDPLEIRYRTALTGGTTAVLVPYNSFGKENFVDIFRTSLVCIYKTTDEYAKTYDESVKSIEEQIKSRSESVADVADKLKDAAGPITGNTTKH